MADIGFDRGRALFQRHLDDAVRPREFTLLGRTWELLDGVFAPVYTPVTGLFSSWIPYPEGGTFLEIGSGCGVTAVVAAKSGCRDVTALDISAAAVENTSRNAERHGVTQQVRVLHSDLFDALGDAERFDMIFWNSNFAEPPPDFVNETDLHHAFFDPRYETHRRYLREAPRYLNDGGKLLLGFSSIGNWLRLRALCEEAGLEIEVLRTESRQLEITLEFQLLSLQPANGRSWLELVTPE